MLKMIIGCLMLVMCGEAYAGSVKVLLEPSYGAKQKKVMLTAGFNVHEPIMSGLGVNLFAGVDADQTGLMGAEVGKMELKTVIGSDKVSIQPGVRMFMLPNNQEVVGFVRFEYKL